MSDGNDQENGAGPEDNRRPGRRKMRQGIGEPADSINIRAAVSDINAFVEFCETNRFTLGQGLRELVRMIPRAS